jgi:hypothetical protein
MMICDTLSARSFLLCFNFVLPEEGPGEIPECTDQPISNPSHSHNPARKQSVQTNCIFESMYLAVMLDKYEHIRTAGEVLTCLKNELKDEQRYHLRQALEFLETTKLSDFCLVAWTVQTLGAPYSS